MTDPLRRRPSDAALRWATDAVGAGSRIVSVRRLTAGGWHSNHALSIIDRRGVSHRLVLRRWERPEWKIEDPDFTAEREGRILGLLEGVRVPTPKLIAADTQARSCDVPTLLITRLPGRLPGLPRDMGAFLGGLAGAIVEIHAVDDPGREQLPAYHTYYDMEAVVPPQWSRRPEVWNRAIEVARAEPPRGPCCFIHRDYHPGNTLWWRGRLTGVVDWTSGSWGPAAVDVGHMRWNLALSYGLDAADEFLRQQRALSSQASGDQRYWDLVTVLDLVPEVDPVHWSRFDLERLERYVETVLGGG